MNTAIGAVLGDGLEEEVRALVESRPWYSRRLTFDEVFRLWMRDGTRLAAEPEWVLEIVRPSERKFLTDALGVPREKLLGSSPRQIAGLVLRAAGLPNVGCTGVEGELRLWRRLGELVQTGEDERAAVLLRQSSERLLRKVLYFYCRTRHGARLVDMLNHEGGSLRIPDSLQRELKSGVIEKEGRIASLLLEDGWADLGFLALALRKLSSRIQDEQASPPASGSELLAAGEAEAFLNLGRALQPYAHDAPSRHGERRQELEIAVDRTILALEALKERGVLPDELRVVETGASMVGLVCRGTLESGAERCLCVREHPPLGRRILFAASGPHEFAEADWVLAPWPMGAAL